MRYLLLSDIHANQVAFEAVMAHASKQRWDKVIFLGDIVGYYTEPTAVIAMLRELDPVIKIMGNHDDFLLKLASEQDLGVIREDSIVAEVLQHHLTLLSEDDLNYLRSFQPYSKDETDKWETTHGGLDEDKPWEYITGVQQAQNNAPLMKTNLCFIGHTHIASAFACVSSPSGDMWRSVSFKSERNTYRVPPIAKIFFNPGSVGQPRDGVPLASYAVFDDETMQISLFRIPFDIVKVQRQIKQHDYKEALATRLNVGR